MSILSLKRWERVSYEIYDYVPDSTEPDGFRAVVVAEIHMKLKRLKRHEAKPLTKVLVDLMEAREKAKAVELSQPQKAAILAEVYKVIPEDQLKNWFASCVKDVEGLEIDDEPVTSGSDLLDNADDHLLFWLLFKLNELSKLTSAESNASASRSGSLRLVRTTDGASPAATTDGEAGREPSTATEIPSTPASSTARE